MNNIQITLIYHLLAILVISIFLSGCNDDLENGHHVALEIIENEYFPLDKNDVWIYAHRMHYYDDVLDSIDSDTTITTMDTITDLEEKILNGYMTRKFMNLYLHSNENEIILFFDTSAIFSDIQSMGFLFTNSNDTSWSKTIVVRSGETYEITFVQRRATDSLGNEIHDELELDISWPHWHTNPLEGFQEFNFKKEKGLVRKYFDYFLGSEEFLLIEFIDN